MRLEVHVRRFFCPNQECVRRIFTERLPGVVAPYARRTRRVTDLFTLIRCALGGEAGKRLVAGMGEEIGPETLLRLVRKHQESQISMPRVLGQKIREASELVTDVTTMVRERQSERLDAWQEKVEAQESAELKNVALGVKRDDKAVKAGLTLEWSNGQDEGQVHRLKLLKRSMYGRGRFDLLRKRVLKRAWKAFSRQTPP